jgi:membrane protein YqaA with SNARE-associated domain
VSSTTSHKRASAAVLRALDRVLPGKNPTGTVYGTITVGALLAAESALRDTYLETVGSVALALAIYWLAHSYAELLGRRLTAHERLTVAGLGRALGRDWAIVRGAGAPLLALLVAWVAGASQETAVTVALWTCVASLLAFELLAGLRARARPAELALELCVGAAMGLGVILLRVILH